MSANGRIIVDGRPVPYAAGDSVAVAVLRAGEHPGHGGTICLAGDCGNCVAEIDGIAYTRTCQTPARPGVVMRRHPIGRAPTVRTATHAAVTEAPPARRIRVRRDEADVVIIGAGESGTDAAARAAKTGRDVVTVDAGAGIEVVGIYPGPTVIARTPNGMAHIRASDVVVATGAAELHPVCEGNMLAGLLTARAAERLHAAGVDLGVAVALGEPPRGVPCTPLSGSLIRLEGDGRVSGVVTVDGAGDEQATPCETVIFGLGLSARDLLSRMAEDPAVAFIDHGGQPPDLPPAPTSGIVCPCSRVAVDDLAQGWARGFHDIELLKRATLVGVGTCQGSVCLPHLRAFVAERTGQTPAPFTARPAARQITLAEAAAGMALPPFRRTALHDEHLALGAQMDRMGGWWRPWHYGDHVAEYWAVREGVSLGDVSTLGKLLVSGPDVVNFLERLYPIDIGDIAVGRSRYALLLDEGGHAIDDGMVLREAANRFVLTFTSAGAGHAEMWVRDWIDTWGLRVHVLDRTMSLGAINVTGPLAGRLLERAGLSEPLTFLRHLHADVFGVPCHVMRLSFTGEMSFELHHRVDRSVDLWRALMAEGRDLGVAPHGIQALQGLRLEKGHVIIGMDTDLDSTPTRLGMAWAAKLSKGDFIGRDALVRTSSLPDHRRLVGLTMSGKAPVEGSPILSDGEIIGHVSSTFSSPLLGHAVMLGWLRRHPFPEVVEVDGRSASIVQPPFYDPKGGRARA